MIKIKRTVELSYKIILNDNFQIIREARESNYDWDDKIINFYQNGKIQKVQHLNPDDSISSIIYFHYDNQFRLTKEISDFKNSGDKYVTTFEYCKNVLTKEVRTTESTRGWIEEDYLASLYEPSVLSSKIYIYDENERLVKTEIFPDHITATIKYDLQNRIKTREVSTGWSDGIEEYDELGRINVIKSYSSNEGLIEKKYLYDDFGNVISYILNEYRQIRDEEGNSFFSEIPNHSTNTTYKYRFDENGNWIERIQITNNEFKYKVERSIEYY